MSEALQLREPLRLEQRFVASPPERAQWQRWSAADEALLREHYAAGGLRAALRVLPGRTRGAIYARAVRLDIHGPHFVPKAKGPRKYETSEAIDAEVRRVYESGPSRAQVLALAQRLMRPVDWIYRRAGKLGLVTPRFKQPEWSESELALVEKNAHKSVRQIHRILTAAGCTRTENAICIRLQREGFERQRTDAWSGNELAKLLGVSSNTVARWVRNEGLPAARAGTDRIHDAYVIRRAALRRWVAAHAQHVDLRKVDRYWFIDLAFGAGS